MSQRRPLRMAESLAFWYPYRWAVSYLPPGGEFCSARMVAAIQGGRDLPLLKRLQGNISKGLPELLSPGRVAKEVLAARLMEKQAALSLPKMTQSTLGRYLTIRGEEHLKGAIKGGGGCILTYPTMGPTTLALMGLSVSGYSVNRLAATEPISHEMKMPARLIMGEIRNLKREMRDGIPGAQFDARKYLRPVLRSLSQGEIVAVGYDGSLPDGDRIGRIRMVEVPFLGQRAWFPVGPIYLAIRSGVPLLPMVFKKRLTGHGYELLIENEMQIERKGELKETLQHNASRLAEHLEIHLRSEPGSWQFWGQFEPGKLLV